VSACFHQAEFGLPDQAARAFRQLHMDRQKIGPAEKFVLLTHSTPTALQVLGVRF
jgi:hypothetical protein